MDTTTSAGPSTGLPSVWATLRAHDAAALISCYENVFGFRVTARYADGPQVHHAELCWSEGAGGIMLGSVRPDSDWTREPGTAGLYVVTSDLDALHQRVVATAAAYGVEITRPPADTDYGSREFAVRDPEGNLWSFGTYPGRSAHPAEA